MVVVSQGLGSNDNSAVLSSSSTRPPLRFLRATSPGGGGGGVTSSTTGPWTGWRGRGYMEGPEGQPAAQPLIYALAAAVAVGLASTTAILLHRTWNVRDRSQRRTKLEDDLGGREVDRDEEEEEGDGGPEEALTSLLLAMEGSDGENAVGLRRGRSEDRRCIYLDYNGTTPVRPAVVAAMVPYLTRHFGNPSSGHLYGREPRHAVRLARLELARLLLLPGGHRGDEDADVDAAEANEDVALDTALLERTADAIVFTGCGTEADNLAIYLALQSCRKRLEGLESLPHVVTSNVEHPAVAEYLAALEERGEIEVTYVEVNTEGLVTASSIISAIRTPQTCLVTLMLANNESGAVMPVAPIASECRRRGVLFHTDAAQAVGKIPVDVEVALGGADMVTIVGHKFGAPKGVAALYVRPGCLSEGGRSEPPSYGTSGALLLGGGQEGGRRAGTENVPYIVGMGRAAALVSGRRYVADSRRMQQRRARLLANLVDRLGVDVVRVNGPRNAGKRLPNTLSVGLRNVHGGELLRNVGDRVAASAGSACHASTSVGREGKISSILTAMKVPREFARGTLRLSVGIGTTERDVDDAAEIIAAEAKRQLDSDGLLQ